MWSISKEAKKKFSRCSILPIRETDEEWEISLREAKEEGQDLLSELIEELEEAQEELLQVLPLRFIPYVENKTLNQPSLPQSVREDYLKWVREMEQEFEQILNAAYEHTKEAVSFLSPQVQEIFDESLHDSTIDRIERDGDTLHLYIDTEGGFSTKSYLHFTFEGIQSEETDEPLQIGHWIVYDELQKTKDGFAFCILFESPESEWTIAMKSLEAEYFYRPSAYTKLGDEEKLDETSLEDYIKQLNPDLRYWMMTPDGIFALKKNMSLEDGELELDQNRIVLTIGNEQFSYDLEQHNPIKWIHTDVYEDPYAQFNEPIPAEELEAAALSDELELQVRAWNTMYSNTEELADIINRVLAKLEVNNEIEMMVSVYVSHFYENGILTEAMIEKFRAFLD